MRVGTFDILRARGDRDLIRRLATYIATDVFEGWESLPTRTSERTAEALTRDPPTGIASHVTEGTGIEEENRFTRLYRQIVRRNARTVAAWQAYGFMNGVLNTDNTSVFGLSVDFGPFAFMDDFDPNYSPNHDDHALRYSYRNQPTMIYWNLVRLGESLGELMGAGAKVDADDFVQKGVAEEGEEADELVKRAEAIIGRTGAEYKAVFLGEYQRLMARRLGLLTQTEGDFENLFSELLDTLEALELDFNQFFRKLSAVRLAAVETEAGRREAAGIFFHHEGVTGIGNTEEQARDRLAKWLDRWRLRIIDDWGAGEAKDAERQRDMKAMNPKVSASSTLRTPTIDLRTLP